MAGLHHIEIWLPRNSLIRGDWQWLLTSVGYVRVSEWREGESWSADGPYLTLTTSPRLIDARHDRRAPGVNHIALSVSSTHSVDTIVAATPDRGWRPLYADRYPHAGGPAHYAAWLENVDGFKVEIVADTAADEREH
jgi:hypothetical protein